MACYKIMAVRLGKRTEGTKKIASIWQEGRRTMELQSVEQDSLTGQSLTTCFVLIAAWAGEKNLALQQLAIAG
jgi:hypothetical protein